MAEYTLDGNPLCTLYRSNAARALIELALCPARGRSDGQTQTEVLSPL